MLTPGQPVGLGSHSNDLALRRFELRSDAALAGWSIALPVGGLGPHHLETL